MDLAALVFFMATALFAGLVGLLRARRRLRVKVAGPGFTKR
jgi:hypothetical protein